MGKFFDLDSPFMRFFSRVGDLIILNVLMMICCIPIITVGASYTAMHYVLLKMIRGEEGYLVRGFFKSFAANFRQATLIWLGMLVLAGVYIGDAWIFLYSGITFPRAVVIAVIVIAIPVLMIEMYVFPVLCRFENTIKNTVKNAMVLAFANLPKTLLMAVFYAVPIVISIVSAQLFIFVILFGISLPAYGAAWLYSGIFKKFEPETEQVSDLDFTIQMDEENNDGEQE